MKLRIVWVGKTKDPNLARLVEDFASRAGRFVPVEIAELKDSKTRDVRRREDEASKILEAVGEHDRVIVLDSAGVMWDSKEFAAFIGRHLRSEPRRLTFVIGGYAGITDSVRNRAERLWSLSPLTFTHDMTRVLLLEQLYRALATLRNHPYSK